MKVFLSFYIIVAASAVVLAQGTTPTPPTIETPFKTESKEPGPKIEEPTAECDLKIPNSPILLGLQLGMSEAEASLKLHRTPFETDASNSIAKKLALKFERPDELFANVVMASLSSKGEKVSSIRLEYSTKWSSVKDFVLKTAPSLGVVRSGFRIDGTLNQAKMSCKEFTVELKVGESGSEIKLTDIRN